LAAPVRYFGRGWRSEFLHAAPKFRDLRAVQVPGTNGAPFELFSKINLASK
jgi:hypothetical protein